HGEIRGRTDLAGEAEHVGIQPVLQQSRFLNLVGGTMRGGLIDDACQCAKLLGAGGYSRVVQRICHLGFSFGWDLHVRFALKADKIAARTSARLGYTVEQQTSTILPLAPGSRISLCARAASASGNSLPTTGRSVPFSSPAMSPAWMSASSAGVMSQSVNARMEARRIISSRALMVTSPRLPITITRPSSEFLPDIRFYGDRKLGAPPLALLFPDPSAFQRCRES